jgi:hypothetical protein
VFGVQVEGEARQLAQFAYAQGKRSALTIADDTALSRRLELAFLDEWSRLGARPQAQFAYSANAVDLNALRQAAGSGQVDIVFLAVDSAKARLLRPYLPNNVLLCATSQIAAAQGQTLANFDLDGIRFVDMPWLLAPDHPAVMIYPRMESAGGSGDLERLYALGIDAYRIAADLLGAHDIARKPLDGVTGRITLTRGHLFAREAMPAQFANGKTVVSERP